MPSEEIDLIRIVKTLEDHDVRYVLVGGMAVYLHGGETPTLDVDLAFSTDSDNVERLADALADLNAKPKRWAVGPYRLRLTDLATSWLHLESAAGDIDLISKPPGTTFEELEEGQLLIDLGGVALKIAATDALIKMKRTAGRPRDLRHVEELETLRKISTDGTL